MVSLRGGLRFLLGLISGRSRVDVWIGGMFEVYDAVAILGICDLQHTQHSGPYSQIDGCVRVLWRSRQPHMNYDHYFWQAKRIWNLYEGSSTL